MRTAIFAILLWGSVAGAVAADPLDTWYWRNPSSQGNPLNSVCFGADEFVTVGGNGTVMTSPDGNAWLSQSSGTRINLRGITHGGGRYVAVGDHGLILYSDDARTWQGADSPWFYHLKDVTWGNGLFVAVGEDTAILTAPDGIKWTLQGTGSEPLMSIAFANGVFIAGGGDPPPEGFNQPTGPVTQILLRSNDGLNWSPVSPGIEGAVTAVDRGLGKFVLAVSRRETNFLLSSTDGWAWNPSFSIPAYGTRVSSIASDGARVRAVLSSPPSDNHGSLVSVDGLTWAFDESALLSSRSDLAAGAGRFVSVGASLDYNDDGLDGIVVKNGADPWSETSVAQKTPGRLLVGDNMVLGLRTEWDSRGGDHRSLRRKVSGQR